MIEVSLTELQAWAGDFFWPFLRLSALFMAAPIFGARTVPVRVRIILAVAVTFVIQPSLPFQAAIDPLSVAGFNLIIQQISIGVAMAMVIQLIFSALVMTGQIIATSMGLGFASTVDPQNGVQVTIVGQFYLILSTLLFLAIDGHLLLIKMLADSFVTLPISSEHISIDIYWSIANFTAEIFIAAVMIALPIMLGVLLVNLGFGVMTRAAPQLNIFAVGFPTTMLAGFVLMLLSLPLLSPLLLKHFENGFNFIRVVIL